MTDDLSALEHETEAALAAATICAPDSGRYIGPQRPPHGAPA